MKNDKTYWLYFNNQSVGAVRMPAGATAAAVRAKAVKWNRLVPLSYLEPPFIHEYKIKHSRVRLYE